MKHVSAIRLWNYLTQFGGGQTAFSGVVISHDLGDYLDILHKDNPMLNEERNMKVATFLRDWADAISSSYEDDIKLRDDDQYFSLNIQGLADKLNKIYSDASERQIKATGDFEKPVEFTPEEKALIEKYKDEIGRLQGRSN